MSKFRVSKNRKNWKGRKKPQELKEPVPLDIKLIEDKHILQFTKLEESQLSIDCRKGLEELHQYVATLRNGQRKPRLLEVIEQATGEDTPIVEEPEEEDEYSDMEEGEIAEYAEEPAGMELVDITKEELEEQPYQDPYNPKLPSVTGTYLMNQCPYCFAPYSNWVKHQNVCEPRTFDVSLMFRTVYDEPVPTPTKRKRHAISGEIPAAVEDQPNVIINCLCGGRFTPRFPSDVCGGCRRSEDPKKPKFGSLKERIFKNYIQIPDIRDSTLKTSVYCSWGHLGPIKV